MARIQCFIVIKIFAHYPSLCQANKNTVTMPSLILLPDWAILFPKFLPSIWLNVCLPFAWLLRNGPFTWSVFASWMRFWKGRCIKGLRRSGCSVRLCGHSILLVQVRFHKENWKRYSDQMHAEKHVLKCVLFISKESGHCMVNSAFCPETLSRLTLTKMHGCPKTTFWYRPAN